MPLLTIAETAHELRVSIRTIEREISDGRLVVTRIRSRLLCLPVSPSGLVANQ